MKKEDLFEIIGQIDDDLIQQASVKHSKQNQKIIRWCSLTACFCIIIAGFAFGPKLIKKANSNNLSSNHLISSSSKDNGIKNNSKPTKNTQNGSNNSSTSQNDAVSSTYETTEIATDYTLWVNNKSYYPINIESLSNLNIQEKVSDKQIGSLIGTTDNGQRVFIYKPLSCEAVVVIEIDNSYKLYSFCNFKSYENNSDEDMIKYLELYGIQSQKDIKKITVDEKKLDKQNINIFYDYFSVLKNSSQEYFEALKQNIPKQDTTENTKDQKDRGSSNAFSGTTALDNQRNIVIESSNGLSFEVYYYPNIEFISRHKISKEFSDFLKTI